MMNRQIIVLGSGFKSMVAAYAYAKAGKKVIMLEETKDFGGFFKPIKWKSHFLDKGPQFFDNFAPDDWALMKEIIGKNIFKDIGFRYSSFMNGKLTENFAIPDWRSYGTAYCQKAFFELLDKFSDDSSEKAKGPDTLLSLIESQSSEEIKKILASLVPKFLINEASEISSSSANSTTLNGRRLLLQDAISKRLKSIPEIDRFLAAQKISVGEKVYNLYPKGSNLEVVRQGFYDTLISLGVDIRLQQEIAGLDVKNAIVKLKNGETLSAEVIFCGLDIRRLEQLTLNSNNLAERSYMVPEIFHIFEVSLSQIKTSNYYMVNYDNNHVGTRTTIFANYMQNDKINKTGLICVEQPTKIGSKFWNKPDLVKQQLINELVQTDIISSSKISDYVSFKVPVTYKLALNGFENEYEIFHKGLKLKSDRFLIPNCLTLTRKQGLDDLRSMGVLN